MEIKYAPQYAKGATNYIVVHHTGGLGTMHNAPTQHLTARSVDDAHRERFGMLSSLGHYGGYNFFIEADGTITQFRAIGEETAAQRRYNYAGVAISVCLAGNFTPGVERPTFQQVQALKGLLALLPPVALGCIVPHRALQTDTECYGYELSDTWARELIATAREAQIVELQTRITLLQRLLALWIQLKQLQVGIGRAFLGASYGNCLEQDNRG